ncbi:MAG: UDP-N-acetylmuramate dehydrogenase [Parcubacteria group bacterium]
MLDIKRDIILAPYTTFRIGGPARFFVEVFSEDGLIEAVRYAKNNKLPFFVLGGGSNLLVSDKGFDGLVIKIKLNDIEISDNIIKAGAGVLLSKLVRYSAEKGLSGMEWAISVPGTVGGAAAINAGCFGGEISESVDAVRFLNTDSLKVETYSKEECGFSYRSSVFKDSIDDIILSVSLALKSGDFEEINSKIGEIIEKRVQQQPQGMSAGSFFKKVSIEDEKIISKFENDGGPKFEINKISAGWIIDQAGLKGKKIGGAMVSEKHANFIINTGTATAEDVVMLASFVKQQVRDKFGIQLQEEIRYVGF